MGVVEVEGGSGMTLGPASGNCGWGPASAVSSGAACQSVAAVESSNSAHPASPNAAQATTVIGHERLGAALRTMVQPRASGVNLR